MTVPGCWARPGRRIGASSSRSSPAPAVADRIRCLSAPTRGVLVARSAAPPYMPLAAQRSRRRRRMSSASPRSSIASSPNTANWTAGAIRWSPARPCAAASAGMNGRPSNRAGLFAPARHAVVPIGTRFAFSSAVPVGMNGDHLDSGPGPTGITRAAPTVPRHAGTTTASHIPSAGSLRCCTGEQAAAMPLPPPPQTGATASAPAQKQYPSACAPSPARALAFPLRALGRREAPVTPR